MYETICDPSIVEDILQDKSNFALKRNIFSMKNISEIMNNQMLHFINKSFDFIMKHFKICEVINIFSYKYLFTYIIFYYSYVKNDRVFVKFA